MTSLWAPGNAGDNPGSAGNVSGNTSNHSRVCSLYSYLCIYVSMYLYTCPSTHAISGLAAGGACEQIEVRLKMTMVWTQRYTPRPWSSQFGDELGHRNRAYLEIHLEAVIQWTQRYNPGMWSSDFGDPPEGPDRARLDDYLEAVNGRRPGWRHSIHQLVNSQPWECDNVTLPLISHGELADDGRSCREVRRKLNLHSGVNS